MAHRAVRWLQQGRSLPLVSVVGPALAVAVLLALARDRGPLGLEVGAGSPGGRLAPGGAVLASGESMTCIPTAAHVAGALGTNWRTDLEVHNPG